MNTIQMSSSARFSPAPRQVPRQVPREVRRPAPKRMPARPAERAVIPASAATRAPTRPCAVERRGDLRLTRRGRVVVTLLMLLIVLVGFTMFSGYSAASGEAGTAPETRTVVVDEGDTLWGIAASVAGERDLREVVHEIEALNSLPGPGLVEGQELAVPLG